VSRARKRRTAAQEAERLRRRRKERRRRERARAGTLQRVASLYLGLGSGFYYSTVPLHLRKAVQHRFGIPALGSGRRA